MFVDDCDAEGFAHDGFRAQLMHQDLTTVIAGQLFQSENLGDYEVVIFRLPKPKVWHCLGEVLKKDFNVGCFHVYSVLNQQGIRA